MWPELCTIVKFRPEANTLLGKKMRQTLYITRLPKRACFYRSTGTIRKEAQAYFCASIQYQSQERFLVSTSSTYGSTTCLLSPAKHRLLGSTPLHGDLMCDSSFLGTVDIACAEKRPSVEVKTATLTIFVEKASLPGSYSHIMTEELGYLAEFSNSEPSFSELWNSRLGFWRSTWGALLPSSDRLATELVPALHFTCAVYEFIVNTGGVDACMR